MINKNKKKAGFTLVELVVVIAIIAILGGVSIATYVGITNNARISNAGTEGEQLKTQLVAGSINGDVEYSFTTNSKTYKFKATYDSTDRVLKFVNNDSTNTIMSLTETDTVWDDGDLIYCISAMAETMEGITATGAKFALYSTTYADYSTAKALEIIHDGTNKDSFKGFNYYYAKDAMKAINF